VEAVKAENVGTTKRRRSARLSEVGEEAKKKKQEEGTKKNTQQDMPKDRVLVEEQKNLGPANPESSRNSIRAPRMKLKQFIEIDEKNGKLPDGNESENADERKRRSDFFPEKKIKQLTLTLKRRKLPSMSSDDDTIPTPGPKSLKKVALNLRGKWEFHEPPSNEPIMSVTGLPLGIPPTAKIRKESLWPRKHSKKSSRSKNSSRVSPATPSADEEDSNSSPEATQLQSGEYTRKLRETLKTRINEKLQKPSEIRSSRSLRPVPKEGASKYGQKFLKNENTDDVPQTPRKSGKDKSKKKIKNSSPKKNRENPFGYNNPMQLAGEKRDNAYDVADPTKDNEDFCSACGGYGKFLCCESCPKSFHFACCYPPYEEDELPEGEWLCKECETKKNPPPPHKQGLFAKLLDGLDRRNPTQFRLPRRITDRFEGVSVGKLGEYEDTNYKPYRPAKIGSFEQTNPELHYDKDGNALVCVKCGLTGITAEKTMGKVDKPIITCEYCPSTWHLDCLDPPMAAVKQLGTKWKCPNHAGHLLPNKQRRLKKPQIADVDQVRGFKNDGDIDIELEDSDDGNGLYRDIPTPSFFENEDIEGGVSATANKAQLKLWNDKFVVHRVPERGVVLDFLGKIKDEREQETRAKVDYMYRMVWENHELLKRLVSDENRGRDEKQAIKSLVQLKELDFEELLKVVGAELENMEGQKTKDSLTDEEVGDLLYIKKLLALKGRDQVMEFLKK
jgi:hypothetical protein